MALHSIRSQNGRQPSERGGILNSPAALSLAALLVIGCGGDDGGVTTPPPTGTLSVSTTSIGSVLDPDGYTLVVDGSNTLPVGVNDSATAEVPVGQYSAELTGLADNCTVVGDNPIGVTVVESDQSTIGFDIVCPPFHDYIAFVSTRDGAADLFVMRPDGSSLMNLTRDSAGYSYPSWAPDNIRIAFTRDRDVWVFNTADFNVTRLTHNAGAGKCDWSPDGTRIAYSSFTGESQGETWGDIYVINADGSNPVNLTPGPAVDSDPAWSPDGSTIAFARRLEAAEPNNIWVMQADGSNPVRLTNHQLYDTSYEPAWSPDGTRIAYSGPGALSGGMIWVMDSDGMNATRLTDSEDYSHAHVPTWSPDGTRIAFWAYKGFAEGVEHGYEIYAIDADGSNDANLTNHINIDVDPTWSSGGGTP